MTTQPQRCSNGCHRVELPALRQSETILISESTVQRRKNHRRVRSVLGRVRERYIFALILSDKKKKKDENSYTFQLETIL